MRMAIIILHMKLRLTRADGLELKQVKEKSSLRLIRNICILYLSSFSSSSHNSNQTHKKAKQTKSICANK